MSLEKLKSGYEVHMKDKGYSKQTMIRRRRILKTFWSYCQVHGLHDTNAITLEHIQSYLKERYFYINEEGRQNSVKYRNNEITALRKLLQYMWQFDITDCDLSEHVAYIRGPVSQLPKDVLSVNEIKKILQLPDIQTVSGYRDRTILEVLIATGLRRYEIVRLNVEDVDVKTRLLTVREGKFQKDRVVPLTKAAASYLKRYIIVIRESLLEGRDSKVLFISNRKIPFTPTALYDQLIPYIHRAKLKKRITLHSFRHTVATHLIEWGMPLRHVQELLGHSDMRYTMRYVQLNVKTLAKEYLRCHPLGGNNP